MAGAVRRWLPALLLALCGSAGAQPLVRLDHIPTAAQDLDQAVADYRSLGFAIKPGRPHANGLRNAHIKFSNGAGLELITASEARDALSARYMALLREGEGPAYLTLHAVDSTRAAAALQAAGIPHRHDANGLALTDPRLSWVFFAGDNRSPTDRPEHFAHANGAFATREVWVATDDATALSQLLSALGASSHEEKRCEPFETQARVFDLAEGGRIVIVPSRHQLVPGHPIIGITMAARSGESTPLVRVHGLWLTLQSER
ncbi:VOC family protein [Roseateles sp. P5_E11]